jgi:hypothetical protein
VSGARIEALGRLSFLNRLHAFLCARVLQPGLRNALTIQRESTYQLWNHILDSHNLGSEYRTALFLSYALCRRSQGQEELAAIAELLSSTEPEFAAKSYFEDSGIFRFSEFDL